MLTIACVLKSGGQYDASWVEKLKRGVDRHLSIKHHFVCLSDIPVPCKRIALKHDWPAWWSKIELFRKGVLKNDTLYLDLDTVITGNMDDVVNQSSDFAMLKNFHDDKMVGSGVMWFRKVPHEVYDKFVQKPWEWIEYYQKFKFGNHVGDQAFIYDTLFGIDFIESDRIKSYKKHCREELPQDASIVCFHGLPRPDQIRKEWMKEHWA